MVQVFIIIDFYTRYSDSHPAVAAAQDPASTGADEAGGRKAEVLDIRVGLHHAPRPEIQHLIRSSIVIIDEQSHLEWAGGVQSVHQQSPAAGVWS